MARFLITIIKLFWTPKIGRINNTVFRESNVAFANVSFHHIIALEELATMEE
jgi:hypothetical protein